MFFSGFFSAAHWAWLIISFEYFSWWSAFIYRTTFLLRLTPLISRLFYDAFSDRKFNLRNWTLILNWRYLLFRHIIFFYIIWRNIILRYCCGLLQLIQLRSKLTYFFFFFELFFCIWLIIWSLNKII